MPAPVVIADDHQLVRAGFVALIERMPGFELVGEAETGWQAIDLIKQKAPRLVLLDISMPELNGLDALEVIQRLDPPPATIMISMYEEHEYVRRALDRGASGYLLKDAAVAELELALRAASRGEVYLSPKIAGAAVSAKRSGDAQSRTPLDKLTRRQRQVLQLLVEGRRTRDIAARLNVSVKTVESHRSNLAARLGVSDLPGMTRIAIRYGLISDDDPGAHP